jgi:predicted nucleotide-binding protein
MVHCNASRFPLIGKGLTVVVNASIIMIRGLTVSLPIRTVLEDIDAVCGYLAKKPTGSTLSDAKKILNMKHLDGRKLSALRLWGLIEDTEGRLKNTSEGRLYAAQQGINKQKVLAAVIDRIPPYRAIIERAGHRNEDSISATDVAVHWHEHFPKEASDNDRILNDQAVCLFQIAQGADLGEIVIGRRGNPTRFQFNQAEVQRFIDEQIGSSQISRGPTTDPVDPNSIAPQQPKDSAGIAPATTESSAHQSGLAIFIAHGKNKTPLEQLKKILDQFRVPYRVATEEANLGRPIGSKVRETMGACNSAILIFTADEEFQDAKGNQIWRPSENVVYELGAAGYLYGQKIVIMKEEGVIFSANFRDLGYISFPKDALEAKAMEVLKELIGFGIVKVSA